jgi:hypothetical protein
VRVIIAVCIVTFFMITPSAAWAVHPFLVENTTIQGAGNFLFELDGDKTKKDEFKTTKLTAVMAAGISDSADVSVEVPYYELDPSVTTGRNVRGYGDVQLKLKQRTYENEVNQSFGYQLTLGMPTGNVDKGLGTNNVAVGLQLMDQQECHGNILHASVGYEAFAKDIRRYHFGTNSAITYGFAVEHKFTQSFRWLVEIAGETRKSKETDHTSKPYTAMTGFEYDLFKSWYVNLAARAGLNKDAEDNTVLVGTAWKF